jgi:hypothetical protein
VSDIRLSHPVLPDHPARYHHRSWWWIALASLVAGPLAYVLAVLVASTLGSEWAGTAPDEGAMLIFVATGVVGGLIVSGLSKLHLLAYFLPALLGGLAGWAFYDWVWQGSDQDLILLLGFWPALALVHFLSAWLSSHE